MKKYVIIGVIVVLALIFSMSAFYTVAENQYACTFRFSEIVNTEYEPGLHFKIPFVDSVKYFSKATQFYDIPPSDVTTLDKQNMTVDCYVLWRIEDPQKFYRTLGSKSVAEDRLDGIAYSVLKNTMGNLNQADIINENPGAERNEIYEAITTTVNQQAAAYGIVVEDVKIKRFDLPESNLNAVYTRMISERRQMAEKFTADGREFLHHLVHALLVHFEVNTFPAVEKNVALLSTADNLVLAAPTVEVAAYATFTFVAACKYKFGSSKALFGLECVC